MLWNAPTVSCFITWPWPILGPVITNFVNWHLNRFSLMQHPWDSRNVLVNLIIRYINIIYLSIFTRHSYIHKFVILVCRAFHSSRATGKLAVVNCIFTPAYFVFKNENIKLKVQYGFGLHTGLAGSHLTWTLAPLDPPSTLGI